MLDLNSEDTQPTRSQVEQTRPAQVSSQNKKTRKTWWFWGLFAVLLLGLTTTIGSFAGYQSGGQALQATETVQEVDNLQEQFALGLQDLTSGEYEVARQRFEYILSESPDYPGAAEKLAQVMQIIDATATPTPVTPTATVTPNPTRDLRPVQDLFLEAQSLFSNGDWNGTIDALVNLRKEDSAYQVTQVDRMLYLSLRNRGVDKILRESNLEGGIYDMTLAERFGPLDVDANVARNWARLYLIGSGFWEAYPEQAVYYFGQIASAAPNLRDASGWTARERYRASLIHYGDQFARQGEWCKAQAQYELAEGMRSDGSLQATAVFAALQCSPPTATPLPDTETPTPTETPVETFTPTPPVEAPPTQEPPPPVEDTPVPPPTDTPAAEFPSPEPPAEPTATPTLEAAIQTTGTVEASPEPSEPAYTETSPAENIP